MTAVNWEGTCHLSPEDSYQNGAGDRGRSQADFVGQVEDLELISKLIQNFEIWQKGRLQFLSMLA